MPADSEQIEDGLSRRQVLARGAVAAGVIWAAPVIRTATAYATSSSGTERPCTNFYVVCMDPLGIRPVRFPRDGDGYRYDDISPDVAAAASSTTSTTTSTSTTTTSTTTTTTTTAPPAPTDPSAIDPAAANGAPLTAQTTAPPVDDLGLFPETPVPADPVPTAAPVDPHELSLAAAQGAKDAGAPDNLPPGIKQWLDDNPDVPVRYPAVLPMLTQTSDDAWAVLLQKVEGPDPLTHQCRPVKGWAQSRGKYAEFFLDPNPPSPDETGRRLIFPNPKVDDLEKDPTALIENIIFVYCCPQ